MDNIRHTPGPWSIDGFSLVVGSDPKDRQSRVIADCRLNARANANLIAAAPDLYAELEKLAVAVENLLSADPDMPTYQADYDDAESAMESAKSALAKARGEQS